jgi:hypothetical protein
VSVISFISTITLTLAEQLGLNLDLTDTLTRDSYHPLRKWHQFEENSSSLFVKYYSSANYYGFKLEAKCVESSTINHRPTEMTHMTHIVTTNQDSQNQDDLIEIKLVGATIIIVGFLVLLFFIRRKIINRNKSVKIDSNIHKNRPLPMAKET